RLAAVADRGAGRERSGGAYGDSLRAALGRQWRQRTDRAINPAGEANGMTASAVAASRQAPQVAMRPAEPADLLLRSARLFDPRAQIDGFHDLLVRSGEVAEIAAPDSIDAAANVETIDAAGLTVFPAFVDPHVHLRT